jgi:hypothetical protein
MKNTGIVDQVRTALNARNRLATFMGALLGAIVPLGTYMIAHNEVPKLWHPMTLLVVAGLAYSATTVFQWGRLAFGSTTKALGFAVLVEGIMTFSTQGWLAITALGFLIGINAIATGCTLAQGQAGPMPVVEAVTVKKTAPRARKRASKKAVTAPAPKLSAVA